MENLIVFLIVAVAAVYMGRSFYRQFKGKSGCSSGCSCSAAVKSQCQEPDNPFNQINIKK